MIRKCSNCGSKNEEHNMRSFNIGKSRKWLCMDCYKSGQSNAHDLIVKNASKKKWERER